MPVESIKRALQGTPQDLITNAQRLKNPRIYALKAFFAAPFKAIENERNTRREVEVLQLVHDMLQNYLSDPTQTIQILHTNFDKRYQIRLERNNHDNLELCLYNGDINQLAMNDQDRFVQNVHSQTLIRSFDNSDSFTDFMTSLAFVKENNSYVKISNNFIQAAANAKLPPGQQMSFDEISYIVAQIKQYTNADQPRFFAKNNTGYMHSLILFKTYGGKFAVLVKPAIKNGEAANSVVNNNYYRQGRYKAVKTSGVMLRFNVNKQFLDAYRVVTVSQSSTTKLKNSQFVTKLGEYLNEEGFTQIQFYDYNKNLERTIYYAPYYGEALGNLENINYATRKEIAQQLVQQFKWEHCDIKSANVLWNNAKITFIDFKHRVFTYTTFNNPYRGDYTKTAEEERKPQAIFGLCYLIYRLFNPSVAELPGVVYNQNKYLFEINPQHHFAWLVRIAFYETQNPEQLLAELRQEVNRL